MKLYGFTREQIGTDTGYPQSFPAEYVEQRRDLMRRALAGEASHVETVALRADGATFDADLRVVPVRYRGEPHVLDKTVKTPTWQETLARNQWADLYLAGDAFKSFLDSDTARITKVMDGIGLGKK